MAKNGNLNYRITITAQVQKKMVPDKKQQVGCPSLPRAQFEYQAGDGRQVVATAKNAFEGLEGP